MHLARIMPILILGIILFPIPIRNASAAPPIPTGYSMAIEDGKVPVSINLNIRHNLTLIVKSFVLPEVHTQLEGSNATGLAQLFQDSLKSKASDAQLANFRMQVALSPWSNVTNTQWLNISISFDVLGIQRGNTAAEQTDMSWKSFNVPSDVLLGGVEVNNIGRYLSAPARDLVRTQSGGQFVRLAYRVYGFPVSSTLFETFVAQINTFNFTKFAPPVSSWQSSYDLSSNKVHWTRKVQNLGMSFAKTFQEPDNTATLSYGLFYDIEATIDAPGRTVASGDVLSSGFNDSYETIMGSTIVLLASVGGWVFLLERRALGMSVRKKVKR